MTTKYLAVDTVYSLNWNHHTDKISKKANSMVGFLKRNLKMSNRNTKTNAYIVLVHPHVDYRSTVCNPLTVDGQKKAEAVQRR